MGNKKKKKGAGPNKAPAKSQPKAAKGGKKAGPGQAAATDPKLAKRRLGLRGACLLYTSRCV